MYKAVFAKYYEKYPFLDFLSSLNEEDRADILAAIDKLIELKNTNIKINSKLSKNLRNGIFELRVNHLNKISRSLYFYEKNKLLYFTNGFLKKTDKIPFSEIEKALKIMKYSKEVENENKL